MSADSTPGAGPSTRREPPPPPSFPVPPRERSHTSPSLSCTHPSSHRQLSNTKLPSMDVATFPRSSSPTASTPTSPMSANMRLTHSFGGKPRDNDTPPPQPPPKDVVPLSTDPLIQAARYKVSSRDQEAMKKLRSTMMELSDSGSSVHSGSNSPMSPGFPVQPVSGSMSRGMRSRASTLSKQLVMEGMEQNKVDENKTFAPEAPQTPPTSTPTTPLEGLIPKYVVAVIGHRGTGKTTVIDRAVKSYKAGESVSFETAAGHLVTSYRAQYPPGGKIRMTSNCTFIEINMDALNLEDASSGAWPEDLPPPSGAVLCYDATRNDTLRGLPEALHYFASRGLPTVMMATKSDPELQPQVDAAYANSLGEPYNVGLIEVTNMTHDGKVKARNGIRWLTYKLEQRFLRQLRKASALEFGSNGSSMNEHLSPDSDGSSGVDRMMWRQGFNMTPADGETKRYSEYSDQRSSSSSLQWIMKGPLSSTGSREPETKGIEKSVQSAQEIQPTEAQLYLSLEDLLNQLFTAIVSLEDDALVKSFFLTYRRFCQPREVMNQFLERFTEVESYAVAKDIKHWALQRLTGALIDWTSQYPGDLTDPMTQGVFHEVVALALKHTFMAHLTGELILIENSLAEVVDVDASWAMKPAGSIHGAPSQHSASNTELLIDGEVLYDFESSLGHPVETRSAKEATSSLKTHSSASLAIDVNEVQAKPSQTEMSWGMSNAQSQLSEDSRLVRPSTDSLTSKWSGVANYLLTTDPLIFASELTKMQWEVFSVIRPRDVFRHDFGKEKNGPVGQAIRFFNHVSKWVSTIILSDPKPKHRARLYERLMLIAHQLRRLNNYDSLYALLSGMQETSIHRLGQTHANVQPPNGALREFQNHVKLMDARGGYVMYRKALAADLSQGKPAIPLLTTIMGLVNRLQSIRSEDFRRDDGYVQWDKFARFGEILSVISESQARGPMVKGKPSNTFRAYINDAPIIHDEDELFDRSKMLEPAGSGGGGKVLRRFGKLGFQ